MSAPTADLVIVGAGAAGIEIARIASRAGLTVVVIEQGAPSGRHIFQRVPLLVGKVINNPRFIDGAQSVPQHSAGGRALPVLTGRGLGGSSRVNGNVAYAGPAERYARVFGPLGLDFSNVLNALGQSAGQSVARVQSWNDALTARFLQSAGASGSPSVEDPDTPRQFAGASVLHVNTRRGLRDNHFEAYRQNARLQRIRIVRGQVSEILFDGRNATGVSVVQNGKKWSIHAGEVILSAGAIGSPKLLMTSGVGEATMLGKAGCQVHHDLPHVGRHLKDHANLRLQFSCHGFDTLNQKTRGLSAIWEGAKFFAGNKNSILRGPGASAGLNRATGPDIMDDAYRIQLVHFTQDRSAVSRQGIVFEKAQKASLGIYALWPRSEGSVRLGPEGLQIDQGFLTEASDVETSLKAVDDAQGLIAEMGFAPDPLSDDIETVLRNGVYSGYHLIGSNRMSLSASTGVVAPDFSVHGLTGLSVCDASVMPDHLSSHSYLATIAMARKLAETRGWAA